MKNVLLDLAALLWPSECVVCGAADRDLCAECRELVREPSPVLRRGIGVPCFSADFYEGPLRALLLEVKHHGRPGFARQLGARLRAPLSRALAECTAVPVLIAAPSRASRVRDRGYRHVELMLSAALRGQGIGHVRLRALRVGRGRTAQVGLGSAERERNASRVAVRGVATAALRGREVILVDDVVTTGATLRAARAAVEEAGASVVAAVTLCAVARRDEGGDWGWQATPQKR